MENIEICCLKKDQEVLDDFYNQFGREYVVREEVLTIGVDTIIIIAIPLAQLTIQFMDFIMKYYVEKRGNAEADVKAERRIIVDNASISLEGLAPKDVSVLITELTTKDKNA